MLTLTENNKRKNVENQYDILIRKIGSWPEWKLQAFCLDESDIEIKNKATILKQANV